MIVSATAPICNFTSTVTSPSILHQDLVLLEPPESLHLENEPVNAGTTRSNKVSPVAVGHPYRRPRRSRRFEAGRWRRQRRHRWHRLSCPGLFRYFASEHLRRSLPPRRPRRAESRANSGRRSCVFPLLGDLFHTFVKPLSRIPWCQGVSGSLVSREPGIRQPYPQARMRGHPSGA